jgi:SEC-C motif
MSIADFADQSAHSVEDECRVEMELVAARLRDLILSQPPRALFGFIWAEFSLRPMLEDDAGKEAQAAQFVLAYVHAVLASFDGEAAGELDEAVCAEIVETANHLRDAAQHYCDVMAADGASAQSRWTEAHALSDWISIRLQGHRAPEQEFFAAALAPHDEALRRSYGIGAAEIATGLQAAADAMRKGCARAVARIAEHAQVVSALAADRGVAPERAAGLWAQEQPERAQASEEAFAELFGGGICNLSRHTQLPAALLQDLSFARAENKEFFGAGPLAGTPLRALPVRVKPLIALDGEYFAAHPDFLGAAAYRQILRSLLARNPNPAYRREFRARHSAFGRQAFESVLAGQLAGATVLHEICYRDATTREWVENDTLIRLDDVLILVDSKAGVAATVAPPAADFERQARAAQDTVGKTYEQCRRFFDYLASAGEVPLFRRDAGRYVECARVRLADFRVMLPIGLTVEPLGPFGAMGNALPEIEPILGRLRFMLMSVDELIALRRSLPAAGDLLASLSRQSSPNFDAAMPCIERPAEITNLLDALQAAREPGWLHADNLIRAFGGRECEELAAGLLEMTESLIAQEHGWFQFAGDPPLFCWLQRYGTLANVEAIAATARAAAIATGARETVVIIAHKTTATDYSRAVVLKVDVPPPGSAEHERARGEAARLQAQQNAVSAAMNEASVAPAAMPPARMPGRNEPCWCGSGKKFKRYHGSL